MLFGGFSLEKFGLFFSVAMAGLREGLARGFGVGVAFYHCGTCIPIALIIIRD